MLPQYFSVRFQPYITIVPCVWKTRDAKQEILSVFQALWPGCPPSVRAHILPLSMKQGGRRSLTSLPELWKETAFLKRHHSHHFSPKEKWEEDAQWGTKRFNSNILENGKLGNCEGMQLSVCNYPWLPLSSLLNRHWWSQSHMSLYKNPVTWVTEGHLYITNSIAVLLGFIWSKLTLRDWVSLRL